MALDPLHLISGSAFIQNHAWRWPCWSWRSGAPQHQVYYSIINSQHMECITKYPIIVTQNVILLLLILYFNGNMKQQWWIIDLAMSCACPSTEDYGQVSILTWSMTADTCATILTINAAVFMLPGSVAPTP
uniref:Uncharacterized protein n=1 Tax=Phasianus colchicus TaxID=9054 RepID=A0A669R1X8_PHACC